MLVCPAEADTAENGARVTWAGAGLIAAAPLAQRERRCGAASGACSPARVRGRAGELAAWGRDNDGAISGAELVERYVARFAAGLVRGAAVGGKHLGERALGDRVPAVEPQRPRADPLQGDVVVAGGDDDTAARRAARARTPRRSPRNSWSSASKTSSSSSTPGEITWITAKPSRARIPSE